MAETNPNNSSVPVSEDKTRHIDFDDNASTQTPEKLKSPLLTAAVAFADYVTDKYPQMINDDGGKLDVDDDLGLVDVPVFPAGIEDVTSEMKLGYVIGGSLATMLLSQAETMEVLGEPEITRLDDEAKRPFAEFARQIGDFDYIAIAEDYPTREGIVQKTYTASEHKYLRSGGGYIMRDEIPEAAKPIIKPMEGFISFEADALDAKSPISVAKITVEGKDYYIPSPASMVAYKIINAMESFATSDEQKQGKFNKDIVNLVAGLKGIYGEAEYKNVVAKELQAILRYQVGKYEEMKTAFRKDGENPKEESEKLINEMLATTIADNNGLAEDYKDLLIAWGLHNSSLPDEEQLNLKFPTVTPISGAQ